MEVEDVHMELMALQRQVSDVNRRHEAELAALSQQHSQQVSALSQQVAHLQQQLSWQVRAEGLP